MVRRVGLDSSFALFGSECPKIWQEDSWLVVGVCPGARLQQPMESSAVLLTQASSQS